MFKSDLCLAVIIVIGTIFLLKNQDLFTFSKYIFQRSNIIFRQHAASIYGFVRQLVCQKKICAPVRWITLWVRPPSVSPFNW